MKQLLKSSFVVVSLALAGLSAEATPAVGEKSTYNVELSKGTQKATGKMTLELTAYDGPTDTWTLVTTTAIGDTTSVETTPKKSEDLITDAMIIHVLANCEASGGKSETVTAPAGTFPSCAMPINNEDSTGTLWVSQVPFGYSKWTTTGSDGMVVNGILESFVPVTPAK